MGPTQLRQGGGLSHPYCIKTLKNGLVSALLTYMSTAHTKTAMHPDHPSLFQFKMVSVHSEKLLALYPLSLWSFPDVSVALEAVSMLVWLTMALSHPFKEDRRALPLSTSISPRQLMVWWPHVHFSLRDSPTAAGMKNPTASQNSSPSGTGALKCNKSKRGLETWSAAPWTPKMTWFWKQNQATEWQKFCLTQVTLPDH